MADRSDGSFFLAGKWTESNDRLAICSPYNNEVAGYAFQATSAQLNEASAAAQDVAAELRLTPRHVRSLWCAAIAAGIKARADEFAHLITRESGKPLQYSIGEVNRAITTFTLAGHEALRFGGEYLPLDISSAAEKLSGVALRVPLGPVAAISPFNFPLNLVAHKIAPALAVGCPVILKPAPQTPLTALLLAEVIEAAEVPQGAVSVLPMAIETAEIMVRDERFRVLSFTGSAKVGWHLKSIAGRKRVLLELGGNAPAIIHNDANLDYATDRLVPGSFASAGQVCIKSQRLLVHDAVFSRFLELFLEKSQGLVTGDPADQNTVVGPLIDERSAQRVESWIAEAVEGGAKIVLGGKRRGNIMPPTVLTDVPVDAKCRVEEIFGPVAIVDSYMDITDAITQANATRYGLQAALFSFDTRVLEQACRDLQYGGIIINDSPMVRVDNYPYGGTKESGFGREGVRYAMEEFTEPKMIVTRSMI